MAIEKITKFSDAIQPANIINEVVDVVNNADLEEFVGASESQAGKKGIVPAPEAGSEDRYLNADGTWKEVKQNLTVYTSLEQIGITPGEETFTSIHNALKVNEQIIYWFDHNVHSNYNVDFYPTNYGLFSTIKLSNGISQYQYIEYQYVDQSKNIGTVWETYYNTTYPDGICEWNRHLNSQTTNAQILSGPLNINKSSNYANIVFYTVDGNIRSIETDENMIRLEARTTTETTDRRMLSLYSASNNSLVDALRILDQVNNSINYYRIYGTHNLATQAEAEAGTDNNKPMSPLRVKQAITKNLSGYLTTSSASSTYLPKTGGTITGNLTVNGTITGTKVVGAVYNDYAEFFPRGEETEAGDIIMLDPNSEEEKYIKASTSIVTEYPLVVGVHSEEYSHLIGGELPENGEDFYDYNIDKYIPVGLAGRCKVKIKGKAIKGAPVTISDIPGVGICSNNITNNNIVGYLVESDNIKDNDTIRLLKVKLK